MLQKPAHGKAAGRIKMFVLASVKFKPASKHMMMHPDSSFPQLLFGELDVQCHISAKQKEADNRFSLSVLCRCNSYE